MKTLTSKTIFTVAEAAKLCEKTTGRIRQICRAKKLGTQVNERLRLLSAADIAWLKSYFAESGHKFGKVA